MRTNFTARKLPVGKSRYLLVALLLSLAVFLFGWTLNSWITSSTATPLSTSAVEISSNENLEQVFAAAVEKMQAGQYQQALKLWHRALLLAPNIPEIKVNMGFSLYELGEYVTARDFFINAMEQNAYQANAYYGLAISSEKLGDLEGALGAMRSYIHLATAEHEERFVRLARSALWEWQAQLEQNSDPLNSAGDVVQSADK